MKLEENIQISIFLKKKKSYDLYLVDKSEVFSDFKMSSLHVVNQK